jgi:hypothetical protein
MTPGRATPTPSGSKATKAAKSDKAKDKDQKACWLVVVEWLWLLTSMLVERVSVMVSMVLIRSYNPLRQTGSCALCTFLLTLHDFDTARVRTRVKWLPFQFQQEGLAQTISLPGGGSSELDIVIKLHKVERHIRNSKLKVRATVSKQIT